MERQCTIEVPSNAEHSVTGYYGAALVPYRGHEYRIEFYRRATKAFRDGAPIHAIDDVPKSVKVRSLDCYLVYLKPAFAA